MEQSGIKEILNALQLHSDHMDKKLDQAVQQLDGQIDKLDGRMDKLENKVDDVVKKMDKGFDRLGKKVDGIRVELTETQETVDFVSSKTVQHEKKLRQVHGQ